MKSPLNDLLEGLRGHLSYHTPGYQPMQNRRPRAESPFWHSTADYDVTELSVTDNLLNPTGVIAESEAEVSAVYGAERTTYVTAGATVAIATALNALAGRGKVLVVGNAHASVYHALRREGDPVYRCPVERLTMAIEGIRPATVVVTSPDYYGNTADLPAISALCAKWGAELVIDAAHGSHFAFCERLPANALKYARFVIHSLHKTLPVPTGSALLHYPAAYEERVRVALSLNHTTSPSYPAMAAMERAVQLFHAEGETMYGEVYRCRQAFEKAFRYTLLPTADFSRFVLRFPFSASAAAAALERGGIFAECYDGNKMTLIVTPYNAKRLPEVAEILNCVDAPPYAEEAINFTDTIRELKFYRDFECVPIMEAADRISYWEVGLYPPGTPWAVSGERISPELAKRMAEQKENLFGLVKGKIPVVK